MERPKRSLPPRLGVRCWTPADVATWLATVNLAQFGEIFVRERVDGEILFDIKSSDLQDMGIATVGDRRRLLKALEALAAEAQAAEEAEAQAAETEAQGQCRCARPQLTVAVLGSSPLVHVVRDRDSGKPKLPRGSECQHSQELESNWAVPLGRIDLRREQDLLRQAVRASRNFLAGGLEPTFAVGTFAALAEVLRLGAVVLAITGHTTSEGKILLETETGEAAEFDPRSMLPEMLSEAASGGIPRCIVLSSCYSREAGQAFLEQGARHVVAVERTATVLDSAARIFNATFHHALLVGNTVACAFRFAVSHVRHMSQVHAGEAGKFVLLPQDQSGRHDVELFGPSGIGPSMQMHKATAWDAAEPQPQPLPLPLARDQSQGQTDPDFGPTPGDLSIVGRQRDMWSLILALRSSRCVVAFGGGGVGKATLCRGTVAYLRERTHRYCRDGAHIWSFRGLRTAQAARLHLFRALRSAEQTQADSPAASWLEEPALEVTESQKQGDQVLAKLGDQVLVLTNLEELMQAQPQETVCLLADLLSCSPGLRLLLTSRRRLPLELWPSRTHAGPLHVHIKALEPEASAKLLLRMAPSLKLKCVTEIAALCGHLPLALKIVGQRLAVASDTHAAANDFIAETKHSPRKRASMLFSTCVAPYVWRTLDAPRRSALSALSLLRGAFDLSAATAVLGTAPTKARSLLSEFQDQCLVEEMGEAQWCIPTAVHHVVQHCFATVLSNSSQGLDWQPAAEPPAAEPDLEPTVKAHECGERHLFASASASHSTCTWTLTSTLAAASTSSTLAEMAAAAAPPPASPLPPSSSALGDTLAQGTSGAELREASCRLVLHVVALLRDVGRASFADRGRGAGLEAFDRRSADVETALVVAGTSDLFVALVQFGRHIFETRLAVQRRVEIYERLLGLVMARRAQSAAGSSEVSSPHFLVAPGTASPRQSLPRTVSWPARRGADAAGRGEDGGGKDAGASAGAGTSGRGMGLGALATEALLQAPLEPLASEASAAQPALSVGAAAPQPPSFVLASYEEGAEPSLTLVHESLGIGSVRDGEVTASASLQPGWCPVFTAEHNKKLRPLLDRLLEEDGRNPTARPQQAELNLSVNPGGDVGEELWHRHLSHDSVLIEVLLRLGLAYSSLGRFSHATQLLRKALRREEELEKREDGDPGRQKRTWMRPELLGTLSSVLCQQGLWQDAEAMLWQARQLAKRAGHDELHTRLTCDLADLCHKSGNLKCAAQFFDYGLNRNMQTLGLEHLDTAATLNAVGVFSAQRGQLKAARRYISKAAQIRQKLLGPFHITVAEALHNLAGVHETLQEFTQAEDYYEQALHIKQQVLPEGHTSIAETENNLSILYSKMRKHQECVALLRRCLEQCRQTLGENHASTAALLMNLGHALHSHATANFADSSLSAYVAQLDEAKNLLERAFSVRKALFHTLHPCIAPCHANLGCVHYKMGHFDIAERHFKGALAICRHHFGDQHPDVPCWLYWLGKTRHRAGRAVEAREDLSLALRLSEQVRQDSERGGQNPFTVEQLADLQRLLGAGQAPEGPQGPATGAGAGAEAGGAGAGAGAGGEAEEEEEKLEASAGSRTQVLGEPEVERGTEMEMEAAEAEAGPWPWPWPEKNAEGLGPRPGLAGSIWETQPGDGDCHAWTPTWEARPGVRRLTPGAFGAFGAFDSDDSASASASTSDSSCTSTYEPAAEPL